MSLNVAAPHDDLLDSLAVFASAYSNGIPIATMRVVAQCLQKLFEVSLDRCNLVLLFVARRRIGRWRLACRTLRSITVMLLLLYDLRDETAVDFLLRVYPSSQSS